MRAIRKHLGVTQERLAEELSEYLSVNFISRLERTNDQNVSLKSLRRIANALQIPITYNCYLKIQILIIMPGLLKLKIIIIRLINYALS